MRVAGVFVLLFVLFYVVCRLRLGRPIVLTLGLCGLRWGELEGLQAGDVDLKRQRIHVRRSATEVCHEIVVDVTKTGGGAHRHLPALAAAMSRRRLRWPSAVRPAFPRPAQRLVSAQDARALQHVELVLLGEEAQPGRCDRGVDDHTRPAAYVRVAAGACRRECQGGAKAARSQERDDDLGRVCGSV